MQVFRIQENTPEVYTNTSRDFQLIGRLYDCIINGIKFDTDSILDIIDTTSIDSKLLKLLQTKIGFFTSKEVTDDDLRYVLKAFPIIVKNKGSLKGIKQAVSVFLKLKHIKAKVSVDVFNKYGTHPYVVQINLNVPYTDTILLDEILKYVLPTGYVVAYSFYNDIGKFDSVIDARIGANIIVVKDSVSSLIRGNYISYRNTVEDRLIGSVGETQLSLPYNSTYMGTVDNVSMLPNYSDKQEEHIGEMFTVRNGRPWEEDFSISSYMYLYSSLSSDYGWIEMGSSSDQMFDVFRGAVYGYINNDSFYGNSVSQYTQDLSFSQNGLMISDDSDPVENPDEVIIPVFNNGKLYDPRSDVVWFVSGDEWLSDSSSDYGVQIVGNNPNEEINSIVPKPGLVVYRDGSQSSAEAVWETVVYNNEYRWGNAITDENEIQRLLDRSVATIDGVPSLCKIVSAKNDYLYSSNTSWYLDNGEWQERSTFLNSIQITGNPNTGAYIIPNTDVHLYNSTHSWTYNGVQYSDIVSPQTDILYIDIETSCGYKYDTVLQTYTEVMHFLKAENVYSVTKEELDYMIEYGLLRPAFRDNTTIFSDNYGNVFLL